MNKQQIINTVIGRLLKQGSYAFENGICQYLLADGRKCAAGVLMTNVQCKALNDVDDGSWLVVTLENSELVPQHLYNQGRIIDDLQEIHDTGAQGECEFVPYIVNKMGAL